MKYSIIDRKIILAPEYLNKEKDAAAILQQQTVTGTVTDSQTGDGMPGVNIVVQGSSVGAISDVDGSYTITAERNANLTFSFIGYVAQTLPINGRSMIDVALVGEVQGLNEVVVVGYGTQSRRNVTGSVASANMKQLEVLPVTNISQAFRGTVAGVQFTENGRPGQGGNDSYPGNPFNKCK